MGVVEDCCYSVLADISYRVGSPLVQMVLKYCVSRRGSGNYLFINLFIYESKLIPADSICGPIPLGAN